MSFPNLDRIDGIFNYCDRWCERCPFTTRCSLFAIHVATAMCGGDHQQGMDLAIAPPPPRTPAERAHREALIEAMDACMPTDADLARYRREEEARDGRLEETPAVTASLQAALLMDTWLGSRKPPDLGANLRAAEALDVARWDRHLIPAKVRRALQGLDEHVHGEGGADDPVQNDWNGTAKLTMICVRRSIDAWDTLAEELRDPEARAVSDQLRDLDAALQRVFPDAWRFVRPGFDAES